MVENNIAFCGECLLICMLSDLLIFWEKENNVENKNKITGIFFR
jgi:hypothetical protein